MRRKPVDSSVFSSVGYDADNQMLEIEFISGDVYRYFLVPQRVHRELLAADSPGRYFGAEIRDRYPTEQV